MLMKKCTKCGELKPLDEYHRAKLGKMGRAATCKSCKKLWQAEYYIENKDVINGKIKRWQEENPEKIKEIRRAIKQRNRTKILSKLKDKYWSDPESSREKQRKKRRDNPELTKEQNRRSNTKRRSDPKFRVESAIRNGIRSEIRRGSKKKRKTFALLGYSPAEMFVHLERQFTDGMSWENYGEWHIDHVIPLSAFNYETPDDIDFARAWCLENLRPMWAKENMQKGSKILRPFQPSLALSVRTRAANDNQSPQEEAA